MGGTKIVVLQLKELIKAAVYALVGIVLLVMLIYFFLPKDKTSEETTGFIPGTYSSEVILHNSPVSVEVTVTEDRIASIELKNMAEIQEVFYPLINPTFENISAEIIRNQTTDIAVSTETQYTSFVLIEAVKNALNEAREDSQAKSL